MPRLRLRASYRLNPRNARVITCHMLPTCPARGNHCPPNCCVQLPQRLQSFYLGPEARQLDLYTKPSLPQRPASASSTSTLPHPQGTHSSFAHVKPRMWSSAGAREWSPNRSLHSQVSAVQRTAVLLCAAIDLCVHVGVYDGMPAGVYMQVCAHNLLP